MKISIIVPTEQMNWGNKQQPASTESLVQTETHILPELSYLRNARWWMVGEQPPKQSSKRNLATSSGDILDSFLCTPSRTRIVAAFVSITTSNCNNKNYIMSTIPIISETLFEKTNLSQHLKIRAKFMYFFFTFNTMWYVNTPMKMKNCNIGHFLNFGDDISDLQWSATLHLTPHTIWHEGIPCNFHMLLKFNTWTAQGSPVVRWYFIKA